MAAIVRVISLLLKHMAYKSPVAETEEAVRSYIRYPVKEVYKAPEEDVNFTVNKKQHIWSKREGREALADRLMCKQPGVHI